ncbi:hypothetical protein B0H10DRAFT_2445947 [Mycena sp. CBHHK59/15]|nr:hypothetical protein B0H10DRAFT_2445947 [Mycena sp. CBHHK59/15]
MSHNHNTLRERPRFSSSRASRSSLLSSLGLTAAAAKKTHMHPELWSSGFWTKIGLSAPLVLADGVFAGLALRVGRMGLDELHLRVVAASSEDYAEKRNAKKVLVVLLIGNVIINESLPIFLDSAIGGGFAAVALSTTAIVIFGSALPPALRTIANLNSIFLPPHNRLQRARPAPPSHSPPKKSNHITKTRRIIPRALSVCYGVAIGAACARPRAHAPLRAARVAHRESVGLGAWRGRLRAHKEVELPSFLARVGEPGVCGLANHAYCESCDACGVDVVMLSADAILDDQLVETILLSSDSRFPVHEPEHPDAFIGLLLIKKVRSVPFVVNILCAGFCRVDLCAGEVPAASLRRHPVHTPIRTPAFFVIAVHVTLADFARLLPFQCISQRSPTRVHPYTPRLLILS